MPKDYARTDRVAEQIQRELAELVRLEVKDPRVRMITLTGVEVARDYSHAKVFYTTLEGASDTVQQGLERASGFLRSQLAHIMKLRITPQLHFIYDESVERGIHLSQLIEQAVASDKTNPPQSFLVREEAGTGIRSFPDKGRLGGVSVMARNKRPLDGVLLFDKPLTLSSNTALQKVRRLFQAEKAGHTGTLDPLATGLLPICFGEATKFSTALLDADKTYRALIRLGQTTTTGDAEGEITGTYAVALGESQVREVLRNFIGEIRQLPPMHSAIKHQGKPLYEYIRKGETIARECRNVIIHELVLERFAGDELEITVRCSKGTYIRTLAEDIGKSLGCGAHLQGLRRTAIAGFRLEDAYSWPRLEAMTMLQREDCLLPLDCLLQELPMLELDAVQVTRMAQGQRLAIDIGLPDGKVRLYGAGRFIGVADLAGRQLAPNRLLSSVAKNVTCAEKS